MFNYRRIFTSTAKFRHVIGKWYLPFFVERRAVGVLSVSFIVSVILIWVFGLYRLERASIGVVLFAFLMIVPYFLDKKVKPDNLHFEIVLRAMFKYIYHFWIKKNDLYQDKELNQNRKRFTIK
ncbi:hypothetical protein [Leuconostoc pseudomesenteroides]|uniref:hypothetical protein n=1 Tax=Leuconostoc pseudomesenteroides TaxID=33968 RepID=UPI0032DE6060